MRSIELFAGAGGLGMGVSRAGFQPALVVEWDRYCCDTIRENQFFGTESMREWTLVQGDVANVRFSEYENQVDLITGGPPCQPFSIGGKHRGFEDARDMFPQAVRAVREIKPRAFIFENVKGLTRATFASYFEYIRLQLTHPELVAKSGEDWLVHMERLERYHTKSRTRGLLYRVLPRVLNAANYGVPQKRERVFFVGFRSDLNVEWAYPMPTHTAEALYNSQWVTGNYWHQHKVLKRDRPKPPAEKPLTLFDGGPGILPWRTVRDAISDLPDPEFLPQKAEKISNHRLQAGARSYKGHTGSPLDCPAKTLKAGDHGVPGGENMLLRPDGSVRYFTVRESARLQTFPDAFHFHGSWTESMRQLGNAVPVKLANVVANSVRDKLSPK